MEDSDSAALALIKELEGELSRVEREAERIRGALKVLRGELAARRKAERERAKYEATKQTESAKAKKAEMQKRLEEGPAMREAGLTYADIGAAWGIGADRAREIVRRAERIKAFRNHNGSPETP